MMLKAVLIVGFLYSSAHAGNMCATDDHANPDPSYEMKALEQLASSGKESPDYNLYCLRGVTKYRARIMAACTKIVTSSNPTWDGCMELAASLHEPKLGPNDVFEWISELDRNPWRVNSSMPNYPLYMFEELGDPRGAALIVATWKESIPTAAKHEHSSEWMADWSGWRQHAAEALAVIGGADDTKFLDEQAKATVDTHVRDACLDAAKAIAKRLAKP